MDHLRSGRDVIVSAPTGAGKTYVFELLHESKHLEGQAVYTVPTRALANDKYAEWKERGWNVGIATGDLAENIHAPVLVATLETQLERLIRGEGPDLLVIDEYQMISDEGRGAHYEGAIALAGAETLLLLLSGSVANPEDVATWMRGLGRSVEVVVTKDRPVPLEEVPIETLPQNRQSRDIEMWWPKMAISVLTADLAPLLIFSPRRKDAENIARTLANELPQGQPLSLTLEQRAVCGKELSAMIEKRIAYHHSGLSYAARAGVIEPLAKAGQLRVIVATMGLAAGINFSVRSVHVAATKFHDGIAERILEPDELLQMFGRAGRRGLDEVGYIITTRNSPSLHDARAGRLHRSNLLAWPMFLRVMKHAADTHADPFAATETFARRLFAKAPPPLGLENDEGIFTVTPPTVSFGLEAMDTQVLNSAGEWETKRTHKVSTTKLLHVWKATSERRAPLLSQSKLVSDLGAGFARLFRIDSYPDGSACYGLEMALGSLLEGSDEVFRPTKALRKLLRLGNAVDDLSLDELEQKHLQKIERRLTPAWATGQSVSLVGYQQRDGLLMARFDLRQLDVTAYEDVHGRFIYEPEERHVPRRSATAIELTTESSEGLETREPKPGSPIHTWRGLELIDSHGVPTTRGEIVSFFQHGEGLAIAAALEDETYLVEDLVLHMANLRAGFRFDIPGYTDSERLAAACRRAFGFVNHHGYLNNGLPLDYGEGAAEVIASLLHKESHRNLGYDRGFGEGDISRAYLEWVSLIRHIVHAPSHSWSRWHDLQAECTKSLKAHTSALRHLFHLDVPPLTAKQKHGKVMHHLLGR
ncbi:MAG: DEAD/DEAH box helicase [Verrucomicrobiaceae bacterium]|nr:DEAD/DEAH box helicase [Verrucomicrobiaceae bacterium]